MAIILFAWELGENFGHISKFVPLALACRRRGHEPVFVVRDVGTAEILLAPHAIAYYQAPMHTGADLAPRGPTHNYAAILLRCGYADTVRLAGLVASWRRLIELIGPAMAIFDHSPSATLACRGLPLRTVMISSGFFIPPDISPWPQLQPQPPVAPALLQASDDLVLSNINRALSRLAITPLRHLTELFAVEARFLETFAELDHYGPRQGVTYWGGAYADDIGPAASWPDSPRKRIYVYMRPHMACFDRLLSQLRMSPCEVLVCAPGITDAAATRYHNSNLRIVSEPLSIASLRGNCDLAILYGGHATICACLQSAIPLLLLPQQLEQSGLARRACELGAAIALDPVKNGQNFLPVIAELLDHPRYREAARRFAAKYADHHPSRQAELIADQLMPML